MESSPVILKFPIKFYRIHTNKVNTFAHRAKILRIIRLCGLGVYTYSLISDNPGDYYTIGRYLHPMQDLYAHSNYGPLLKNYYGSTDVLVTFEQAMTDPNRSGFKTYLQQNLATGRSAFILLSLLIG